MASREFEQLFGGAPSTTGDAPSSLDELRRAFDDVDPKKLPAGLHETAPEGPPVPCRWLTPAGPATSTGAILYLHGGGYVSGSARSHRHVGAYLAEATSLPVLMVDYRLAPEHQFPAGRDDVVEVYRWLMAADRTPTSMAIVGDSAGAGLAMSVLLELRAQRIPMPGAVALLSPWVDLTVSGASMVTHRTLDPMIGRAGLLLFARAYLGPMSPLDPRVAPLVADLANMPPCLIQVGDRETLLDDAIRLAGRLAAAGSDVEVERWPEMVHVWHALAPEVPEAMAAIRGIGAWLAGHGMGASIAAE